MPTPDFPSSLAFYGDLRVTPRYRTLKSVYESAQEQRFQLRLNPIYDVALDYRPILPPPLDMAIVNFWHRVRGDALAFYFQDWSMVNRVTGQYLREGEVIGIGNGARVLFKVHEDRLTVATIYVDDMEQMSGVTVDDETGLVTFDDPPAVDEIITADVAGGFFRMRFEGDELPKDRVRPQYWSLPIAMHQVGIADAVFP